MATIRYCPHCGTEAQVGAAYCTSCGHQLSGSQASDTSSSLAPADGGQAVATELQYRVSLNRILLMTVLSYGSYLLYWFYLTWKQYRDHTGEEVYPVWHALTQLVPIYSLFRMHTHTRIFKELMTRRGLETTIAPGLAVVAVMVSSALDWQSFRLSLADITQASAITIAVLDIVSMAIVAWLLVRIQDNLNAYWHHLSSGRLLDAPVGIGEVIFGVIGVLAWLTTLTALFYYS